MNHVHIQGFKCFTDNNFSLGRLTVLAGINGAGKTSLLHVFAALHQTACETGSLDELLLNGGIINIGQAVDVLNRLNSKSEIVLEFTRGDERAALCYQTDNRESFTLRRAHTESPPPTELVRFFQDMSYIAADRQGPKDMHFLEDSFAYGHGAGVRGERTVSALNARQDMEVLEGLRKPCAPQLPRQLEAHMSDLFENFKLEFTPIQGTNIARLGLANDSAIGFVRPQNIGFGLSYTLPIYVTCLSAKAGALVIIENPEAHLHPRAQSRIGQFIAQAAAAGVQIMVETHSDHLLNGIRKAAKHGIVQADDVVIHFFAGLDSEGSPSVVSPRLLADGSLSMWPDNFFDQFDKDLSDILEW